MFFSLEFGVGGWRLVTFILKIDPRPVEKAQKKKKGTLNSRRGTLFANVQN